MVTWPHVLGSTSWWPERVAKELLHLIADRKPPFCFKSSYKWVPATPPACLSLNSMFYPTYFEYTYTWLRVESVGRDWGIWVATDAEQVRRRKQVAYQSKKPPTIPAPHRRLGSVTGLPATWGSQDHLCHKQSPTPHPWHPTMIFATMKEPTLPWVQVLLFLQFTGVRVHILKIS
jgi:hypothetical protein